MSDGGGVGLNLAMGSINLSGLEDSNVNGIVELPFYKGASFYRDFFLANWRYPGSGLFFKGDYS